MGGDASGLRPSRQSSSKEVNCSSASQLGAQIETRTVNRIVFRIETRIVTLIVIPILNRI